VFGFESAQGKKNQPFFQADFYIGIKQVSIPAFNNGASMEFGFVSGII